MAGGERLELATHDISCAGIGLTSSRLPEALCNGLTLAQCAFALPEEKKDFLVACTIRHLTEMESHSVLQWRIGLEFASLSTAEENRIQRYIARVEHERRETS